MKILCVDTEYTGNAWVFSGQLEDGTWFLTDDEHGDAWIYDADPAETEDEESDIWDEWAAEHKIRELNEEEAKELHNELLDVLSKTDEELSRRCKEWWG